MTITSGDTGHDGGLPGQQQVRGRGHLRNGRMPQQPQSTQLRGGLPRRRTARPRLRPDGLGQNLAPVRAEHSDAAQHLR
ncbi:hypothetical protein [Amycolatopsis pigmentata]|uniref:hypothetical protein n=1 Tax=Amycolatopsis pigmentata TaxID=450801 RepID=UPI003670D2BE